MGFYVIKLLCEKNIVCHSHSVIKASNNFGRSKTSSLCFYRNASKRLIYDNGLHQNVLDFLYSEYKMPHERKTAFVNTPSVESTYPTWRDNAFLENIRKDINKKSPYGIVPITLVD